MESLSTVLKETKDALFERIKNPFLGSFFFFWLIWNWKYWGYILFGSNTFEFRIYKSSEFLNWWFMIPVPLGLAFLYTIGSSYIFNKIESWSKSGIKERRKNYYVRLKEDYEDRKDAAKELYELKKIQEGITQLQELKIANESITEKLEKANQLKDSCLIDYKNSNDNFKVLFSAVNEDFKFDLFNEQIFLFVKNTKFEVLFDLGKSMHLFYNSINSHDTVKRQVRNLTNSNLIKNNLIISGLTSNGVERYNVTMLGRFLLKIYIYSSKGMKLYIPDLSAYKDYNDFIQSDDVLSISVINFNRDNYDDNLTISKVTTTHVKPNEDKDNEKTD